MQELGESPLRGPGRKEHREFVERLERATPHLWAAYLLMGIDNAAHVGGLVTGIAVGALAARWRRI